MYNKRVPVFVALVVVVSAFTGCLGEDESGDGGGTPTNGGGGGGGGDADTITVGTTDTITSLDPGNAYEYLSINVLQNTMATLLSYKGATAEVQPGLAELPEVSEDGTTYTFQLKEGIQYSDGTPITADDFLWALERNSGEVGGQEGGPAFLIYSFVDVANSTAPDNRTLVLKLHTPAVFFPSLVVFPNFAPLPRDQYTQDSFREPTGATQNLPVSSGPYRITEYRAGESLTMEANPNYTGPNEPQTDRIVLRFFQQSASMKSALQNNEIDVAFRSFTPEEWNDLENREGIQRFEEAGPAPLRMLAFNVGLAPMDQKEVRQAISYVLDRDQINEVVFLGSVRPAFSIVPEGFVGHKKSFEDTYGASPNVEQATQILQQAGYSESNKLEFDLWFNSDGHYGDTEDELAQVIKQQLEQTGLISVTLRSKAWAEYTVDFRQGNYAAFLIGWYPDYVDPDNYLTPFLSEGGAASFGTFYSNPEVEELLEEEATQQDEAQRTQAIEELQDIAAEDVPYLPIFTGQQQAAAREGVEGITLAPTQIFYYHTLTK